MRGSSADGDDNASMVAANDLDARPARLKFEGRYFWSGGHFGESAGTFGQSQFFHEPSSVTQADEVGGTPPALAA